MNAPTDDEIELIAARSRALGDTTRVRILMVLGRGEQAVGQIAHGVGTPQSTASKHLQVLFHSGLVQRRRDASTVMYSLAARTVLRWLRTLARRDLGSSGRRMVSSHGAGDKKAAQRGRG